MQDVRRRPITPVLLAGVACLVLSACASDDAQGGPAGADAAGADTVDPAARVHVTSDSDERAIEIAQSVVDAMGGWEAWDDTRYLKWRFFGRRLHHWDRETGDVRIEGPFGRGEDARDLLILMNVRDKTGRVWADGEEITDPAALEAALQAGYEAWINDSYWLVMPFKLLDPGVTLKYLGERTLDDGRAADVLELTFDGVGVTPENRYEVYVAKDTGLVEQWSFFRNATDTEPGFTLPWADWERFDGILIATRHQNPSEDNPDLPDWEIEVLDELPAALFEAPDAATSTG